VDLDSLTKNALLALALKGLQEAMELYAASS
jgi:hypothetical protein